MKTFNGTIRRKNPSNIPMNETHFFWWLGIHNHFTENKFNDIDKYCSRFGFILGENKLDSDVLQSLEYIHDAYYRLIASVAFYYTKSFSELFDISENNDGFTLISDDHQSIKVKPKKAVIDYMNNHLIYDPTPENNYFTLMEKGNTFTVFIKYQKILGNRTLMKQFIQ